MSIVEIRWSKETGTDPDAMVTALLGPPVIRDRPDASARWSHRQRSRSLAYWHLNRGVGPQLRDTSDWVPVLCSRCTRNRVNPIPANILCYQSGNERTRAEEIHTLQCVHGCSVSSLSRSRGTDAQIPGPTTSRGSPRGMHPRRARKHLGPPPPVVRKQSKIPAVVCRTAWREGCILGRIVAAKPSQPPGGGAPTTYENLPQSQQRRAVLRCEHTHMHAVPHAHAAARCAKTCLPAWNSAAHVPCRFPKAAMQNSRGKSSSARDMFQNVVLAKALGTQKNEANVCPSKPDGCLWKEGPKRTTILGRLPCLPGG